MTDPKQSGGTNVVSDLETLKQLFTSWGVPHKCVDFPDEGCEYSVKVGGYTHQRDVRGTVDGYNGMYTLFNFDFDGKFIRMGAWE